MEYRLRLLLIVLVKQLLLIL